MSTDKVLKTASLKVKEFANTMISNGNDFSCMIVDLSLPDGSYLDNDTIKNWLVKLYTSDLKYKQLPERALENMKKKGLTPKKQPIENILITITSNDTCVFVGVSIPEKYYDHKNIIVSSLPYYDDIDKAFLISVFDHNEPLKYRDVILQNMFNSIKQCGLYKEEDEEDFVNYLDEEF